MFQPKFTITPEINNRIAEIEKLKTITEQATILPEIEVQLRFRAIVESVHSSTSIEGNPLSQQQVENILHGKTTTAPDYALKEILNYKKAIDWLRHQDMSTKTFKSEHILKLHTILMKDLLQKEKVGVYRRGPIYIVNEVNGKDDIQYIGPEANDVPKLISSFLTWISLHHEQKKYHPVLLAGLIHYIFVSIHPFSDGNGRTTRLLTLRYLKQSQYDFRESLSLDGYYLQHRMDYYEALSRGTTFDVRMAADLTAFLDFFTKGFLASVQQITQYIKANKIHDTNKKTIRLSKDELQILDFVYEFGLININQTTDILQTTRRTAQRRLKKLVHDNILTMKGKGPETNYGLI